MLKKIFHPVLVVSLLAMGLAAAACSDSNDEGPKSVELTGGTSTQQTVWADETQKPENITFKAAAPWTATVTDTTPVQAKTKAEAGRVDWLTLSAYSGGAGDVSLTMTLSLNLTGQDRKAEIRIVCGGTTLIITVEQKATTESGEKPAQSDMKNRIVRIDEDRYGKLDEYSEFTYDEAGRVVGIKRFQYGEGGYDDVQEIMTITYGDKTIAYKDEGNEGDYTWTSTDSAVLDENGRVVSDKITNVEKYEGNISTDESSNHFTYDANGQLVKTETIYNDTDGYSEKDLYQITWTNGNPTQVIWTYNNDTTIDRATYGTVENKANLDLNWFIALDMEGWHFSVGENPFLAATGYMGKRSKNMAETVSGTGKYDSGSYTNKYQLDSEGRIAKIIRKDNEHEYTETFTIHYAE